MPLNNRMSPAQWQQWLQQVGAPSSSTAAQNAGMPQVQAGPQGFLPTSGPRVEINPPGGGGLPGMPPMNPWDDDFFAPHVYNPNTPNISGVWDPVKWNITNAPGVGNIPFNSQSPLWPNWINMPGLPGNIGTMTDPYTGNPRATIPGAYSPNIFPVRPTEEPGPYPGSVAPLSRVPPIETEFTPGGPAMSMPFRSMEPMQPMGMSMPGADSLPPPANLGPGDLGEGVAPPLSPSLGGPGSYPTQFYGAGSIYGGINPWEFNVPSAGTGADYFGGTSTDYSGAGLTPETMNLPPQAGDYSTFGGAGGLYSGINPWDFSVPTAGATPAPDFGVGAAPAAMMPYDYNLPSNPFNAYGGADLWGGGFSAPQYDPGTLSRLLGGTGLPSSGAEADIPTAPGVEPDVLPALPVTDQRIDPRTQPWTQGTLPGQRLGPRDLINMARQPTDWRNSPAGRFLSALPGSIPALPQGYNPFGGTPPGLTETNRFGGGAPIFRGDPMAGYVGPSVGPGGVYGATFNFNPDIFASNNPFGVGQVGSSSVPAPGSNVVSGAFGGGSYANPSALGGYLRRVPWYISMPGNRINYAGHSTNAPTGQLLTPAEHAWLEAGGVRSGRPGPGVFSRFVPVSAQVSQAVAETGPQPRIQPGFASRHVPARQIQ